MAKATTKPGTSTRTRSDARRPAGRADAAERTRSNGSNASDESRASNASSASNVGRNRAEGRGEERRGDRESEIVRARLFDADRRDRRLDADEALSVRPTERQLLWIDLMGELPDELTTRLAEHLGLRPRTRAQLQRPDPEPRMAHHREYVHVRIAADPSDENPEPTGWLDILAGPGVVVTRHDREIPFLDDVDDRIERDAAAGMLSSVAFFSALLDAAITSYHAAVDEIEEDVDRLDAILLRGSARGDLLRDLVRARRRIGRLRRLLADHRSVFTMLSTPGTATVLDDPDAATLLQGIGTRFEAAIGAVEDGRDALLSSFDIYMSRTAQRTNDVMKVLTIATVLLLPGSVLAGLMGMNVEVPLSKDDPFSFWMVVGALGILAIALLGIARLRRWI
ncbi:MAG TPA: CorA family divalent cation transporter [Candidatus Binatia bacterium]|nr:CorA family divalent cation transporter [Candidatus Binatia bacterium]